MSKDSNVRLNQLTHKLLQRLCMVALTATADTLPILGPHIQQHTEAKQPTFPIRCIGQIIWLLTGSR